MDISDLGALFPSAKCITLLFVHAVENWFILESEGDTGAGQRLRKYICIFSFHSLFIYQPGTCLLLLFA